MEMWLQSIVSWWRVVADLMRRLENCIQEDGYHLASVNLSPIAITVISMGKVNDKHFVCITYSKFQ